MGLRRSVSAPPERSVLSGVSSVSSERTEFGVSRSKPLRAHGGRADGASGGRDMAEGLRGPGAPEPTAGVDRLFLTRGEAGAASGRSLARGEAGLALPGELLAGEAGEALLGRSPRGLLGLALGGIRLGEAGWQLKRNATGTSGFCHRTTHTLFLMVNALLRTLILRCFWWWPLSGSAGTFLAKKR